MDRSKEGNTLRRALEIFALGCLLSCGSASNAQILSPPTIANVAAIPGRTTVVITWTTDALADSQVEFGLTTSYTDVSPLDTTAVVFHAVTLFLLQPDTTYHFRVRSRDAAGNLAMSPDRSFTTLASTASTGVKVAFIGDQGLGANSVAVLELIKNEGAQVVLHQGDLDYNDNPYAWDQQITSVLGAGFPYFASIGNHDNAAWPGYQQKLQSRLSQIAGASCSGDLGVQSVCNYKGLLITFTGPGVRSRGHDAYIHDRLAQSNFTWRISSWHKNQRLMQVGGKGGETGWGIYEESRLGGAIVATGHEHSYERTHLMSSFQNQTVASTADTLQLSLGQSFAFVSGLGGRSIRGQQLSGPWWAAIYTSTQGANFGALFCTFGVDDQPNRAKCYFKDISGKVPDQFDVVSAVAGSGAAAAVTLSSASLSSATQTVGTTSAAQRVTLTNTSSGNATLNITNIEVTGPHGADFALSVAGAAPCSLGANHLAAGTSCTFDVTFTPSEAGARAASVTITSNAATSPDNLPLSGTGVTGGGVPRVSLSASLVTFANQPVGTTSAPSVVTVANTGNAILTITSFAITGVNSSEFSKTDNCAGSVNAGSSCTINLLFAPTATGTRNAALTIAHNAPGSPHTVPLIGTGVDFSLSSPSGSASVAAGQAANLARWRFWRHRSIRRFKLAGSDDSRVQPALTPAGKRFCSHCVDNHDNGAVGGATGLGLPRRARSANGSGQGGGNGTRDGLGAGPTQPAHLR